MIQKTNFYKIKLRVGEIELEIEGDREFVKERFDDMKSMLKEKLEKPEVTFVKQMEVSKKKEAVKAGKAVPKVRRKRRTKELEFEPSKVKEIVKSFKLKTPIQKAAALIHYFSTKMGRPSLKTRELKSGLSKIGAKVNNIYFLLKKEEKNKEALLKKVKRGEWALSNKGLSVFK